ncbi:MAG TPA: hypothetical protein VGL86_08410 [Polyangia bacterium]|jgi:hypothetical protein
MGWLASLSYVPFFVCSGVLGGFALWGWRRSGATGALLIAIAAGLQMLHSLVGVYGMWLMFNRSPSGYAARLGMFSMAQSAGSFVADVLFIVGVALVLRRLPARR